MKRAFSPLCAVLLLATTLLFGNSAAGGSQWCEEDPEFLVNGSLVDVSTFFSADPDTVRSVSFELLVPANATAFAVSSTVIFVLVERWSGQTWAKLAMTSRITNATASSCGTARASGDASASAATAAHSTVMM